MGSDVRAGLSKEPLPHEFASYELRVTARCCRDDLEVDPRDTTLEALASESLIVRKFIDLRSSLPEGQEPFRSAIRSDVFTLHAGQQRGVTWYDREYRVVWLLGFATHREGDRSDSYAYLERLDKRGRLLPAEEDYETLLRDRGARQVPLMIAEVRALLARARKSPGEVHATLLNTGVKVSLCVEREVDSSGGVEEFHLAVSMKHLEGKWLAQIRAALWPADATECWEFTKDFPGRDDDELCFRHWHDVDPPRAGDDG